MPLKKLPVADLDNVNHRRRARETINQVLDHSFDDSRVQTTVEKLAGITPVNPAFEPDDARRRGTTFDNSTDDTAAFKSAITVAAATFNGATGNVVELPLGTSIIGSQVTLPNNVRFHGTNKNGSIFKPSGSWNSGTSTYMFLADNGASSMFDSLLENLTVDANDVAGLGCIQTNAWQENSGLRSALLYRFRTYGLLFSQTGYATSGGAAYSTVSDCEIFASTSGATAGIKVEQISSAGTFVLNVERTTITGTTGVPLPRCIDIVNDSSNLDGTVHFENATTGLYLDGIGRHTLTNLTGDSTVTNVIEIAATFRGSIKFVSCLRGSATNLIKDNRVGGLGNVTEDIPELTIGTGSAQGISAISKAASAVVTFPIASGSNPFAIGQKLTFSAVLGMTQINGLQGTITALGGVSGAWTTTVNINSSGFSAYTSGGAAALPANRAVSAPNTAKIVCTFDGTQTGTFAPNAGSFGARWIERVSAGRYKVIPDNNLVTATSQAISVTAGGLDDYTVNNLGPAAGSAEFTISRLSVSAGALVKTPTDCSFITFIMFGDGA